MSKKYYLHVECIKKYATHLANSELDELLDFSKISSTQ